MTLKTVRIIFSGFFIKEMWLQNPWKLPWFPRIIVWIPVFYTKWKQC